MCISRTKYQCVQGSSRIVLKLRQACKLNAESELICCCHDAQHVSCYQSHWTWESTRSLCRCEVDRKWIWVCKTEGIEAGQNETCRHMSREENSWLYLRICLLSERFCSLSVGLSAPLILTLMRLDKSAIIDGFSNDVPRQSIGREDFGDDLIGQWQLHIAKS